MQGERDGWRVKKGAGRGCLLNHITVKGIALTLSPLCAPSIHTNLLIDRRSSQTAPSSPPTGAHKVPWACLCGPAGCRWEPRQQLIIQDLTRICHVDLKTTCSGCEYVMKQGEQAVFCFFLSGYAALSVTEQIQEQQLQVGGGLEPKS